MFLFYSNIICTVTLHFSLFCPETNFILKCLFVRYYGSLTQLTVTRNIHRIQWLGQMAERNIILMLTEGWGAVYGGSVQWVSLTHAAGNWPMQLCCTTPHARAGHGMGQAWGCWWGSVTAIFGEQVGRNTGWYSWHEKGGAGAGIGDLTAWTDVNMNL